MNKLDVSGTLQTYAIKIAKVSSKKKLLLILTDLQEELKEMKKEVRKNFEE